MRRQSFSGSLIARSQSVWLQSFRVSSQRTNTCNESQRDRSTHHPPPKSIRVGAPSARSSSLGTRMRFNWGVKLAPKWNSTGNIMIIALESALCYFSRVHSPRSVFALILCKFRRCSLGRRHVRSVYLHFYLVPNGKCKHSLQRDLIRW